MDTPYKLASIAIKKEIMFRINRPSNKKIQSMLTAVKTI